MTDLLYLLDLVLGVFSLGGWLVFLFICLFSSWVRPFLREAKRNSRLWVRGEWSLRTGLPTGQIPEAKTPDLPIPDME